MTCVGCIYYMPEETVTVDKGGSITSTKPAACRRYAPRMTHGAGAGYSNWEWPGTDGQGCGERLAILESTPLDDVLYRQIDNLEAMLCRIVDRMPS